MDAEEYKRIVEACFPQISVHSFKAVLDGWDSFVLEVNDEFIFRFPRRPETEAQYRKETGLLFALKDALPVLVPNFEFVWRGESGYDKYFVGYRKINGIQLSIDHFSPEQLEMLARQLAQTLSALHRFPVQRAAQLGVPGGDLAHWWRHYRELYDWVQAQARSLLDPEWDRVVALWEAFLAQEDHSRFQPVLVHKDLAAEHILCDPAAGTCAGIIDWGDAAIGDPAIDFTGLLHDCGEDFARLVLAAYEGEVNATLWQRTVFYSKIIPFYTIQYGLMTGQQVYLDDGLSALQKVLLE